MLINRIIGAFTFRRGVYADVERDQAFTTTAWILVIVVAFLNQLGSTLGANPTLEAPINLLISFVISWIFAVIGFAVSALIISWVGRVLFGAKTDFGEMVRTTGLAYVWGIIGLIGVVVIFSSALACILLPLFLLAWLLSLLARLMAVKEALDLDWLRTIVTVIIGIIVEFVIVILASTVVGLLGFGAATALGAIPGI